MHWETFKSYIREFYSINTDEIDEIDDSENILINNSPFLRMFIFCSHIFNKYLEQINAKKIDNIRTLLSKLENEFSIDDINSFNTKYKKLIGKYLIAQYAKIETAYISLFKKFSNMLNEQYDDGKKIEFKIEKFYDKLVFYPISKIDKDFVYYNNFAFGEKMYLLHLLNLHINLKFHNDIMWFYEDEVDNHLHPK